MLDDTTTVADGFTPAVDNLKKVDCVMKTCGTSQQTNFGCSEKSWQGDSAATVCGCSGDLCNNSVLLSFSAFAIVIATLFFTMI